VTFHANGQPVPAVRDVSFEVWPGQTVGLLGESGSGKSTIANAIIRCLPPSLTSVTGDILFRGENLTTVEDKRMGQIRGRQIAMVFQEPLSALNPLKTLQQQIAEPLILHEGLKGGALLERIGTLLDDVGFSEGRQRLQAYPHQLSGGQRQRVMMAMALSCKPSLLIADEPTTALDVTLQAELLQRLKRLQSQTGMAMIFITHHLGIAAHMANHVLLLKDGKMVEEAPSARFFAAPQEDYTKRLLGSEPSGLPPPLASPPCVLVTAKDFHVSVEGGPRTCWFRKGQTALLKGVDFTLHQGETLGIVGESGSGKTTLAFALLKLIQAGGELWMDGQDLMQLSSRVFRPLRRFLQLIFQDPFGSLNPRLSVGQIVLEGLRVHHLVPSVAEEQRRLESVLKDVGLEGGDQHRYPHEFSGGQRQRIAIARALILKPRLVILDEPTSSLDMSTQSTILDLLRHLQQQYGLSYLFISHDLKVVRSMSHRVLVMQEGRVVETGDTEGIFQQPRHPYTQKLMEAARAFDLPSQQTSSGKPKSPDAPKGKGGD
jgi:microcin C transport system ATP-binding protein